jgi:hypothetical protein
VTGRILLGEVQDLGRQGFDAVVEAAPVLVELGDEAQHARREGLGR